MKSPKLAHTSNSKKGMGDHYGTGVKAKIGKIRDSYSPGLNPLSKSSLAKPPKTLA